MNQNEFLAKLFSLYSTSFSKGNGQAWSEAYKQVLKPNIDYDKLYDYMLANYAGSSAPSPAFLMKNATYITEKKEAESPVFETIIAEKNGVPYEYGIETTYNDTVKWLTSHGFTNIRLKFMPKRFV